ncbi:hypothetical protein J8273_4249 [Carpediemonas membranifera]|uniref:Uncharacterized protein n=1 Tax=Carpediemonas membranifera TaxID=201153 RepID=A0A8J6E488_9EUKA|nr:hypothetical protein J8273_4249 [Carpediemonas membranifera]|eukprot:KAG9394147.1 hypothetical protein J8273_4249 [Carpediemonas membranifera]
MPKILLWIDDQPESNQHYLPHLMPLGVLVIQCRSCNELADVLMQFEKSLITYPDSHLRVVTNRTCAKDVLALRANSVLRDRPVLVFCWYVEKAAGYKNPDLKQWVSNEDSVLFNFASFESLDVAAE